ncbi:MAG: ABC transporter ATP-binding protein [Candidatus Hodarchaeales archaeon]|jgi:ABC-2 type transport system ATP-binding protein
MTEEVKIQIKGLTKYYGPTRGIEDLNLVVRRGEIFGFLGPNGAGKTTTIRCMINTLLPTKGEITISGELVSRQNPELREKIGYVPGELALPEYFTVNEFLNYIEAMRGKSAIRRQEIVDRFDLKSNLNKKIGELSKGNKQKVGIVAAFMNDPDVLIMDEPTAGLDPLLQQEVYRLLLESKNEGKTLFMSSHNLEEVQRVCDRVGIVKDGFLISIEDIDNLNKDVPRILEARLRNPDEIRLAEFGDRLLEFRKHDNFIRLLIRMEDSIKDNIGILLAQDPEELVYPPASLEEFFLQFYERKN